MNKELRLLDVFPGYQKQAFAKAVSANSNRYLDEIREKYLHVEVILYVGVEASLSLGLPGWANG